MTRKPFQPKDHHDELSTPSQVSSESTHTPHFPWKPSYNLGIYVIDRQHQGLLELMSELWELDSRRDGLQNWQEESQKTIGLLQQAIQEHFEYEEGLMAANQFPDLVAHQKSHHEFLQEFARLVKESRRQKDPSFLALIELLSEWIREHLQGTDRDYARYLKTKGIH